MGIHVFYVFNMSILMWCLAVFYIELLFTLLCDIGIPSVPGAGNVSFSLNGTTYQNNSLVTLENIGEGDDALLCLTDQTACCRHPLTSEMEPAIGNWSFPNGTTLPSEITASGVRWDFYSTSGEMVKYMNRRRGGVTGIYSCVIPDAMNVTKTIYIGVYTASTGEWYMQQDQVGKHAFWFHFWDSTILLVTVIAIYQTLD